MKRLAIALLYTAIVSVACLGFGHGFFIVGDLIRPASGKSVGMLLAVMMSAVGGLTGILFGIWVCGQIEKSINPTLQNSDEDV